MRSLHAALAEQLLGSSDHLNDVVFHCSDGQVSFPSSLLRSGLITLLRDKLFDTNTIVFK